MKKIEELSEILGSLHEIQNKYDRPATVAVKQGECPLTARLGDFWYCTDSNRLYLCHGVVNGTPVWSPIK